MTKMNSFDAPGMASETCCVPANPEMSIPRRGLLLGASAFALTALAGCGGGSDDDPTSSDGVPKSDSNLYRALMALRYGMTPNDAANLVGRSPDYVYPSGSYQWSEGVERLHISGIKDANTVISSITWRYSESHSALYTLPKDHEGPKFVKKK